MRPPPQTVNVSISATNNESLLQVAAALRRSGSALSSDVDGLYIEMVELQATSSTTGDIELTNLSVGDDYVVEWLVVDYVEWQNNFSVSNDVYVAINHSRIDSTRERDTNDRFAVLQSTGPPTTMNIPLLRHDLRQRYGARSG